MMKSLKKSLAMQGNRRAAKAEPRRVKVTIRFTDAEFADVQADARATGAENLTEHLRRVCLPH
jgi:hypothetical protein